MTNISPDILWFDNGVDNRYLDPLKLQVAAYYYNRAKEWGKEVSISTKKAAFAPSNKNTETIGSMIDFEKVGAARRPASALASGRWRSDWQHLGLHERHERVARACIIAKLVDTVSKNGTYLLNLSPKADGTFPAGTAGIPCSRSGDGST